MKFVLVFVIIGIIFLALGVNGAYDGRAARRFVYITIPLVLLFFLYKGLIIQEPDLSLQEMNEQGQMKEPWFELVSSDELESAEWYGNSYYSYVDASSVISERHPAEFTTDDNLLTSWQEGVPGYGEGEWIGYSFVEPVTINCIAMTNGNTESERLYYENGHIRNMIVTLGTSTGAYTLPLGVLPEYPEIIFLRINDLDEDIEYVTFTIDSVYDGTKYEDTCMSFVKFGEY